MKWNCVWMKHCDHLVQSQQRLATRKRPDMSGKNMAVAVTAVVKMGEEPEVGSGAGASAPNDSPTSDASTTNPNTSSAVAVTISFFKSMFKTGSNASRNKSHASPKGDVKEIKQTALIESTCY
eukprot:c4745_g1_i1 orf=78-446(+)